jgi:hypothetical protein
MTAPQPGEPRRRQREHGLNGRPGARCR